MVGEQHQTTGSQGAAAITAQQRGGYWCKSDKRWENYEAYVTDRCELYAETAKLLDMEDETDLRKEIEILDSL